jgi:hypothetical protein
MGTSKKDLIVLLAFVLSTDNSLQQIGLTIRPADAGAIPRSACYLMNGKGSGQSRQRR